MPSQRMPPRPPGMPKVPNLPAAAPRATRPSQNPLALDGQLCFALYATSLAMTKRYRVLLKPLGLTYPQYLVMLVLWESGAQTVSQVGDRLALDSGTLTPLLKRLESQGLLQRLRDVADERRVLVQLTPGGRELREQALAVPLQLASASGCGLEEIGDLTRRLHALRERLSTSTDRAA